MTKEPKVVKYGATRGSGGHSGHAALAEFDGLVKSEVLDSLQRIHAFSECAPPSVRRNIAELVRRFADFVEDPAAWKARKKDAGAGRA